MTQDVDLAGVAAICKRSYSWMQRHWRTLKHAETGEPFPLPFVGAQVGGHPWWVRDRVEAWKRGERALAAVSLPQRERVAPAANDPVQPKMSDRAARLRSAAGG